MKFLRDPNYTFIKINPIKRTFELQEVFSGKPAGSKLHVWESIDQFICTFEKSCKEESLDFSERIERLFSRFVTGSYHTLLEKSGGGFSLNGDSRLQIQSGERIERKQKAMAHLTKNQLSRQSLDEAYGIISSEHGSISSVVILGLQRDELDWIWAQLELFCAAHLLNILAPEINYQTYIVD